MIQDIEPHQYDPVYYDRKPETKDYALFYEGQSVLLLKRGEELEIPTFGELEKRKLSDLKQNAYYLFAIDGRGYYLLWDAEWKEREGFELKEISIFRTFKPMHQAFAGITGSQVYRWRKSRRFCGCCGHEMEPGTRERSMVCPACHQTEYPKISSAVIVAIKNGDKLLMTRYASGPYRRYALVAGFVEVGETFEECVRREVMEEVGLKIKNIRYYKSQPWAFSDTEMVGFTAELDGDPEITLEKQELSEAGWFTRDEIVEYEPYISVGHELMKAFKDGRI